MGNGYWILIWDDWGVACNMINPRLLTEDDNLTNWWSCDGEDTKKVRKKIIEKHSLKSLKHFKIIFMGS